MDRPFDELLIWLYNFDTLRMLQSIFSLTKTELVTACTLKLETTNNHYSDIFTVTAKASGNKIKSTRASKPAKTMPKAGFADMAKFVGAM